MILLINISKAQRELRNHIKARRLDQGFTQEGLAKRSGVSLFTLRKYEQKGLISLESFLKLLIVLGGLEAVVDALKPAQGQGLFSTIDEVLKSDQIEDRRRGWRT